MSVFLKKLIELKIVEDYDNLGQFDISFYIREAVSKKHFKELPVHEQKAKIINILTKMEGMILRERQRIETM